MGIITFDYRKPTPDGVDVSSPGRLEFALRYREVEDGAIRTTAPFSVSLADGQVDVPLSDTGLAQCWQIREYGGIAGAAMHYVAVAGDANFADLAEVDPTTLTPTPEALAGWTETLESVAAAALVVTEGVSTATEKASTATTAASTATGAASAASGSASDAVAAAGDAGTAAANAEAARDAATLAAGSVPSLSQVNDAVAVAVAEYGVIGSTIVYHGATAATPRPATSNAVIWVGSVYPLNAVLGDLVPNVEIPAAPAVVYLSDDFNRADGAPGASPVGGITPSVIGTGTLSVLGNAIGWSVLASGTDYVSWDTGQANGVYQITLTAKESANGMSVLFRHSSATNHLLLTRVASGTPNWRLVKRVGSATAVEVAGPTTTPVAPVVPIAVNDLIKVTLNGSSVKVEINGAVFFNGTITDHVTNTRVGFAGTSPSAGGVTKFDNISFTALA